MSFKKAEIRCCELAKKAQHKSKRNLLLCYGNQITAINSPTIIKLFFHEINGSDWDAFRVEQQHRLSGNSFYSGEIFK